jgi:hypothetical protein
LSQWQHGGCIYEIEQILTHSSIQRLAGAQVKGTMFEDLKPELHGIDVEVLEKKFAKLQTKKPGIAQTSSLRDKKSQDKEQLKSLAPERERTLSTPFLEHKDMPSQNL